MVPLIMLAVMAGCAAFLFFKGTLVQGITMILNTILAGFVAFGFFEMLARLLIKYSPGVAIWAPLICFALLFILAFAVLQTAALQIIKEKTDLGKLPEQIGRPACGLVLGYLLTGHALVAAAMAPLPSQYPYPRFDPHNPNPARPSKPVLSPDGFVTGLFATISKGSFSAIQDPKSFAVLHAGYVDQLYLNRYKVSQKVPLMTTMTTINVPKKGVRPAPDSLRDTEGKSLSISPGENLLLVRVELTARALRDAGTFTLSQFRLVCGLKGAGKAALAGQGQAVYPLGYIGDKSRLERKALDDIITAKSESTDAVNMDLAFSVPASLTPLLLEFKRNDVVQVSTPAAGEEPLEMVSFGMPAPPAQAAPGSPTPVPEQPAPGTTPPRSKSRKGRKGATAEERAQSLTGSAPEQN
jgi:hypothetical protein